MSGRKIFVSYKYADTQVGNLPGCSWTGSKVRDYVNLLEDYIDGSDHIYKGESDGEDLSYLSEETIREKLRDRIYDSSLTIVLISPGMKEAGKPERGQWIPWEVAFSLKETSRRNSAGQLVTSRTNAMVALVLPDESDDYAYFLERKACCCSGCTINHIDRTFAIIRKNMFNSRDCSKETCNRGDTIWRGEASYIKPVRWADFIADPNSYIDAAYDRRDDIDSYNICKSVDGSGE